jgi:hypothetical protein
MAIPRILRVCRVLFLSVLAAVAVQAGSIVPARAAYPTTDFYIPYGESYTTGTLTWYDRSVGVRGANKTTGGNCRQTGASAYGRGLFLDHDFSGLICMESVSGVNSFAFTLLADVYGGPSHVEVCLMGSVFHSGDPNVNLVCETYYVP